MVAACAVAVAGCCGCWLLVLSGAGAAVVLAAVFRFLF